MLDDALDRLDADPALTFTLDGQCALVEDYLAVRPDRRAELSRLVAGGRLVIGPWYVLADEILSGAEALIRNLSAGRRVGADLGAWMPVGYSPDAFGHPDALPAILRGFGIDTAIVWRGFNGHAGGDGPATDLFWWEGPDGARVLTHHLPPAGYELGAELPADPTRLAERWQAIEQVLDPRARVPVRLVLNGADHHALQPDLQTVRGRLAHLRPDADIRIGSPADYFTAVRPLADGARVPVHRGELRWSYGYAWTLQGVFATRAGLKRRIAEAALLLVRYAEPAAALAPTDRRALLDAAWRDHLPTLSHDVVCGCCADPVADDAAGRARGVVEQARGIVADALDERLGQEPVRARRHPERWTPTLLLFNPSATARAGVVETTVTIKRRDEPVGPGSGGGRPRDTPPPGTVSLRDAAGRPVVVQVLDAWDAWDRLDSPRDYPDQDLVRAFRVALWADVPALGTVALTPSAGGTAAVKDPVKGTPTRLDGHTVAVSTGQASPYTVAFAGGPTLEGVGELLSDLDVGDTYTREPVAGDAPVAPAWDPPTRVVAGPLVAALARPFFLGDRAVGTVYVRVNAGEPFVRFTVDGVNLREGHRLRFIVPVPGGADHATADMPFGPVVRPLATHDPTGYPDEWPPATAPMHRYVAAGGVTVLARGAFEYELHRDGWLAVTLFRSVDALSRGDLGARPGHAGWPTPVPGARELGAFRVELAVAGRAPGPRAPGAVWSELERVAESFHVPVAGRMLRWGIDVPPRTEGPRLAGDGLHFSSLKPRDDGDGYTLRVVNVTGRRRRGAWRFPEPVRRVLRARLDETPLAALPLTDGHRTVRFAAEARQVVTLLVEL